MPTPNVVTELAVMAAIAAAIQTPYSCGVRYRARRSVPARPIPRETTLVGSVHAALRTALCRRVEVEITVAPIGYLWIRAVALERWPELRTVNNPPSGDRKINTPWLDAATVAMLVPLRATTYCAFGSMSATT